MPHFDGPEYSPEHDHARLTNQLERIKGVMVDGQWRTLEEISRLTGDPHASISAQLRHLRKRRFGSYRVERQARGDRADGLFEYRVLLPVPQAEVVVQEDSKPDGLTSRERGIQLIERAFPESRRPPEVQLCLDELEGRTAPLFEELPDDFFTG